MPPRDGTGLDVVLGMRHLVLAPLLGLAVAAAACSAPTTTDDEGAESSGEALTTACSMSRSQILAGATAARRQVIERAFTWLDANVQYSQSRFYRGYRADCSGFVSMCWDLGQSYTTANFIAGGGESFKLGSYDDLLPGDALVRRSNGKGHIVLFLGWNDSRHGGACVVEQASTRLDMEYGVRTVSQMRAAGYRAIRADQLRSDTDMSAVSANGDEPVGPDGSDDEAPNTAGWDEDMVGTACAGDGTCNPGSNGSGLICSSGQCTPGCRSNAQCPGTTTCRFSSGAATGTCR